MWFAMAPNVVDGAITLPFTGDPGDPQSIAEQIKFQIKQF